MVIQPKLMEEHPMILGRPSLVTNDAYIRWLLLLQEFNITIIDRPGKENLVANFLSRINHSG